MNKVFIVQIAGFLVVPILVMLIVIYFLYPMLNKERYDLIVRTNGTMYDSLLMDSLARMDSLMRVDSLAIADSLALVQTNEDLQNKSKFDLKIDSLQRQIFVLTDQLNDLTGEIKSQIDTQKKPKSATNVSEEAFKDRVKSLLNLEEDEMAPILDKMSSNQLIRLYKEAGNTQREKILRALSSDRAAKLISEVML